MVVRGEERLTPCSHGPSPQDWMFIKKSCKSVSHCSCDWCCLEIICRAVREGSEGELA